LFEHRGPPVVAPGMRTSVRASTCEKPAEPAPVCVWPARSLQSAATPRPGPRIDSACA
jgi:hypothetical protein